MSLTQATNREISCRITRTLIMYVREMNGSSGSLLADLELDETYLCDINNWVSHEFLHILYARMSEILGDQYPVYKMALASKRYETMGVLERIARLLGNPKLIYTQAPRYNKLLKANGDVYIHEVGDSWVVLEDRYHDSATKTRHDCDYTRGVIAGIPTIFDMPLAQVEEIECQVASHVYGERVWPDRPVYGSRGCLYRIQWSSKDVPPIWKRFFQQYRVYRNAIDDLQKTNQIIQQKYDEVRNLAHKLEDANRRLESYTAELRASEQRYRLLAENVTDTIWTMSLEPLRFTYVSPSTQRLRGYTAEEAMAIPLEETVSPESLSRVMSALGEALAREAAGLIDPTYSETLEVEQYHKNGSLNWVEVTTSFLRDEKGRAVGLLGVSRDISERKRAEQLYQAKIAAEAANAAKGQFLSNMSHELRTPLNHIMGFTELILGKNFGGLNATQEEYLTDVYRSSQHLLSLVNDILDVEKIEVGKLEIQPAEINLKHLLEQSLSIVMDHALNRRIQLTTRIDPLPETIIADERRLKQILYNLLSNAMKFTEDGGEICLFARETTGNGPDVSIGAEAEHRMLEISVTDNGIGIRQEDMGKIFEPFSQVEGALNRKYAGSGLGLALARNLVEMHGGRLWAESGGPGRGSTFRFTLPL
ncbi:MAG: PAS domain-containing sensor histidine kinase [Deltaproteobacteria bacterium]